MHGPSVLTALPTAPLWSQVPSRLPSRHRQWVWWVVLKWACLNATGACRSQGSSVEHIQPSSGFGPREDKS